MWRRSEKAELDQEFLDKKNLFMRKARNAGPEARAWDKTYRRLAQILPA